MLRILAKNGSKTEEVTRYFSTQFGVKSRQGVQRWCSAASPRIRDTWKKHFTSSVQALLTVLVVLLTGLPVTASAQEQDGPFKLILYATSNWDSNVFRVPSSAPDPQLALGKTGKADRYDALTFGLLFDKSYALQRFVVDLRETKTRYDKFSSLNRDSSANRARWDWHAGSRISGTLSADHVESAALFEDIAVGQRLVTTSTENYRFTVDGWMFGGWHLLAGISRVKHANDQVFLAIPSSDQANAELGLRYAAGSGSLITAIWRSSRGEYPGPGGNLGTLIDNRFTVSEAELAATWIASMRSTLTGRLTWIDRRYSGATELGFSGMAGELRYSWVPTGRLSVQAAALRTLAPFFQATSSYRADTILSIGPNWTISDKLSVGLSAVQTVTDYLDPIVAVAEPLRRDTTRGAQLSATWNPHRKLSVRASVNLARRDSNYAIFDYEASFASLTASLSF